MRRVAASEAVRLTAVVVLPTPPFWFAMAMTRFMATVYCTEPPAQTGKTGLTAVRPPHRSGLQRVDLGAQQRRAAGVSRARRSFSGHQLLARPPEALARHLVSHGVRGAVLAPRALEDIGQPRRDAVNSAQHLLPRWPRRSTRERR